MPVIDFRLRPYYEGLEYLFDEDFINTGLEKSDSFKKRSFELLLKEMDEADVAVGVVNGRESCNYGGTNKQLFKLESDYKGKFVLFPDVNPLDGDVAIQKFNEYVNDYHAKGISLEPSLIGANGYNDERFNPIFELSEQKDIPVMINAYIDFNAKFLAEIDDVATRYPKLPIIIAHGAYPYVNEICALATLHSNVYISPDAYAINFAGGSEYLVAANYTLSNQILFGSAYPYAPLDGAVKFYKEHLRKEVADKILYHNAAKLLKLE